MAMVFETDGHVTVYVGEKAEPGQKLTCEGCGEQVDELILEEGDNLLCKPCSELD